MQEIRNVWEIYGRQVGADAKACRPNIAARFIHFNYFEDRLIDLTEDQEFIDFMTDD